MSKFFPVLLMVFASSFAVVGCADEATPAANAAQSSRQKAPLVTDLQMRVLKSGAGEAVQRNDLVLVQYTGWLYDQHAKDKRGKQFDSSYDRGPFKFAFGRTKLIEGWVQGMEGMKVGEKREILIPSHLGYGAKGAGKNIPPHAPLIFEIELLSIN